MEPKMEGLYEDVTLHTTLEYYYLEPTRNRSNLLIIDRINNIMTSDAFRGQIPPNATGKMIYGVIGKINLIAGGYLIIITKKKLVGYVAGHEIYQVQAVELLPFARGLAHINQKQKEMNETYVNMLENVFSTPHFYFSYTYDITHTAQRLQNTSPNFFSVSVYKRADQRFTWNGYLLENFCQNPDFYNFAIPVIHGFVAVKNFSFKTTYGEVKKFSWGLISRRSAQRAGVRLFKRGVDPRGKVANYVETEQFLEYGGARCSFIQVRGSIPFFWHQYPNMRLKSPPLVVHTNAHEDAFRKHLKELTDNYGEIVLVNLIDHKGREACLESKFKELVLKVQNEFNVVYESFDFHKECSKMQYHNLSKLMEKLAPNQERFEFFASGLDGKLRMEQTGVLRTNCVDCLDRTNVVQSMLAWRNLSTMLQVIKYTQTWKKPRIIPYLDYSLELGFLGLLRPNEEVTGEGEFYRSFLEVWADNGDCLSTQYAGTGALKSDYTRTGNRTYTGVFQDMKNSLQRYYKNNLKDGFRQDSIDLLLGNYVVRNGEGLTESSPLDTKKTLKNIWFPVILLFAVAMLFANIIFPSEYSWFSLLFWSLMIALTWLTILYYGTEFVDYPKLRPLEFRRLDPDEKHIS